MEKKGQRKWIRKCEEKGEREGKRKRKEGEKKRKMEKGRGKGKGRGKVLSHQISYTRKRHFKVLFNKKSHRKKSQKHSFDSKWQNIFAHPISLKPASVH